MELSITVSICRVCDKGRDPLEVPGEACGHSAESHRRTVGVPVVPADERDRWIRLFNRLEAAITHHKQADRFKDDHDEALYAARDRILRDAGAGS